MRKLILLAIFVVALLYVRDLYTPISHPPGILVRRDPEQYNYKTPQTEIKLEGGWTIHPLASFTVEARVLGKQHYYSDFPAAIAPYDLALGWGLMSDTALLDKLNITQGGRFFHWQYWGDAPAKEKDIISHSANMHLIPADDRIRSQIASVKEGSLVKISGSLVEVLNPKASGPWRSSLTRDDSGAGACEIIYVKALTVR